MGDHGELGVHGHSLFEKYSEEVRGLKAFSPRSRKVACFLRVKTRIER